mmetsp:Transcript_24786/g.41114  ORF Transcript_24786/g.41114 Transcript_24786/m.41114 type:complete len:130 (+) Transcript_24786:405-794(+)
MRQFKSVARAAPATSTPDANVEGGNGAADAGWGAESQAVTGDSSALDGTSAVDSQAIDFEGMLGEPLSWTGGADGDSSAGTAAAATVTTATVRTELEGAVAASSAQATASSIGGIDLVSGQDSAETEQP